MNRYGKYFVNHLLWLDDGFSNYYLQSTTWGSHEIPDVESVVFNWPEEAEQWLMQCMAYDPYMTVRKLRDFLSEHSTATLNIHEMNDTRIIHEASRLLSQGGCQLVIEPQAGWAVKVDDATAAPAQPLDVEPAPDIDGMLEELQGLLNGLVDEQKQRFAEWEAKLAKMSDAEKALVYGKKAGTGVINPVKNSIVDLVTEVPGLVKKSLKVYWKFKTFPLRLSQTTAKCLLEGSFDPLQREIEATLGPVVQNVEQLNEITSMMAVLLIEEVTRDMLLDFVDRYWDSTHPVEKTELGAELTSEVVIAILLILFTAGVGLAANIAIKSGRLVRVAKLLRALAKGMKKLQSFRILPKIKLGGGKLENLLKKVTGRKGKTKGPPDPESPSKKGGGGKDDGPKTPPRFPEKPELRLKYEKEVGQLKEKAKKLKTEGKTGEEIARILHSDRREIGLKYKDLTPSELRDKIYTMNKKEYGDPLGPSIDYLRNVKGKTWDQIADSASNPGGWSRLCQFLEKNGIDPHTYFQQF